MGLFGKRKSRAVRRAERKAVRTKAKLEAKLGARTDRKRLRDDRKSQKRVEKAEISALKAQERAAVKIAQKAERDRFSAAEIRKYLGVARVLTPILLPLAYRASTFVRGQLDTRRAQRLGVGVAELGEYTGHGAKLSARIAGAEQSLNKLVEQRPGDAETDKFAAATRARLTDLETAVRTAELMPAPRRRDAHQAISGELTGIEADLLARLGVR